MFLNLDSSNIPSLDESITNIKTSRNKTKLFDDFLYQVLTENESPWILNSGANINAIDPTIPLTQEISGVIRSQAGDADGTTANDASQIVAAIPVKAENGGLIFETRLHINTSVANITINAGFTDSQTLEQPFEIGAVDAITSNATDAACFVYDTDASNDDWFACAVDGDADDVGNATTGKVPTADTYQTLRIEINEDGTCLKFFINGVLVKTLVDDTGVSPDVNLYATVVICSTTTTVKTVDIDYIYVEHTR